MKQEKFNLQSGGHNIVGIIETPDDKNQNDAMPTVMLFHGGRNNKDSFPSYPDVRDILIDKGFRTVRIDFFGSGESDGHFRDKTNAHLLTNIRDTIDYIVAKPGVDKIGVLGRSQSSVQLATLDDDRVDAAVLHCPAIYTLDSFKITLYPEEMKEFLPSGEHYLMIDDPKSELNINGPYGYNRTYFDEYINLPKVIEENLPKMKNVMIVQGVNDECMNYNDAWKAFNMLSGHREFHCLSDVGHKFVGKEREVAELSVKWFCEHLK